MRARTARRGWRDASRAPAPQPVAGDRRGSVSRAPGPAVTTDAQDELHGFAVLARGERLDERDDVFPVSAHGRTPDVGRDGTALERRYGPVGGSPPQAVCGTFPIASW